MGVVYLGRDPVIGRRVALKTIRGAAEDDSEQREFSERFLREAQAAGTLSHPNIVTVHDVGEEPETQTSFIAMEYVEGLNLKQILKDKTSLTFERIAEIISSVADALDYAHRKGVVHRDVKPANIIITPDGTVKITDFGIAKIETSSLTSTGQFLGTPNYMSPEQVTGEGVDGRSDLFSLGVVLYELLTKRKPFVGDNLTSISYKIVHEEYPPPETFDASIPPEIGPILSKALAKDPAARFQKGSEVVQALAGFRARLAERDMLRDLGAMVAEAEKLGPVSAIEAPDAPAVTRNPAGAASTLPGVSPQTGAIPIVPAPQSAGSTSLEDLSRQGRPDLDPLLANAPSNLGSSSEWSLDTSGMRAGRSGAKEEGKDSEEAVHEPPPSSPGTPITEVSRPAKAQAPVEKPAATPASARPVQPPDGPAVPRPGGASPLERTGGIVRPKAPPLFPAVPASPPARGPARPTPAAGSTAPLVPPASTFPVGPRPPAPMPPPVPAPSREPTGGLRLPVPPPAIAADIPPAGSAPAVPAGTPESAVPALSVVGVRAALKSEVSRRLAWIVLGGAGLLALLIVGLLLRQRSALEAPPADESRARETTERRQLLEEGNRLLAAGKPAEAKMKYLELSRRAPDSRSARERIQEAEALLQKQQEEQRKTAEIQARFSAAKEAEAANEPGRVLGEAEAILILDPRNAEAAALKSNAQARLAKKGVRFSARSPVPTPASTKVVALAPPAPAGKPPEEAAPAPTPSAAKMAVSFASPFRQGYVMVRRNDKEIYRKSFDFGKKSNGGTVGGEVEIPPGPGEFKVWVIDVEGSVREYKVVSLDVPGTEHRTLTLQLDSSKKLSVALQ
jgi:serine/threonine protein kinase